MSEQTEIKKRRSSLWKILIKRNSILKLCNFYVIFLFNNWYKIFFIFSLNLNIAVAVSIFQIFNILFENFRITHKINNLFYFVVIIEYVDLIYLIFNLLGL